MRAGHGGSHLLILVLGNLGGRGRRNSDFEASLVYYKASSRAAKNDMLKPYLPKQCVCVCGFFFGGGES